MDLVAPWPCKGVRIPESSKFLHVESGILEFFFFVESGILEIFACGIRNPGPLNPQYSCTSPESLYNNWNPNSKIWILEPSNCKPESMTWKQNPRVSWISSHGENLALVSSVSQASVPTLCTEPPPPSPKAKCHGSNS